MSTVTVSPKFQAVIPRDVRRLLHIQPGQKLRARVQNDRIKLIPGLPMTAARGFLPGLRTQIEPEKRPYMSFFLRSVIAIK